MGQQGLVEVSMPPAAARRQPAQHMHALAPTECKEGGCMPQLSMISAALRNCMHAGLVSSSACRQPACWGPAARI